MWYDYNLLRSVPKSSSTGKVRPIPPSPENSESEESDDEMAGGRKIPKDNNSSTSSKPWSNSSHFPPPGLNILAIQQIVRGGAYGLTGNAYLVKRAQEIYKLLESGDGGEKEIEEGRKLFSDWGTWKKIVEKRKGRLGMGVPEEGEVWVCPKMGVEL